MEFEIMLLLFFTIFSILFISSYIQYLSYIGSIPNSDTEGIVRCDKDQITTAWIYGNPNISICPPYRNQYYVTDSKLYERQFAIDDNGCCYFSDNSVYIPYPYILIGNRNNIPYTDSQLNQKPYTILNGSIQYTVPLCNNDFNCYELTLIGFTSGGFGEYKIVKYQSNVMDNTALDTVQNAVFVFSNIDGILSLQDGYYLNSEYTSSVSADCKKGYTVVCDIQKTGISKNFFPVAGTYSSN